MRLSWLGALCLALTACVEVPDSGAPIGAEYDEYVRNRETRDLVRGTPPTTVRTVRQQALPGAAPTPTRTAGQPTATARVEIARPLHIATAGEGQSVAAETRRVIQQTRPATATAPVQTAAAPNTAIVEVQSASTATASGSRLSREQDFESVTAARSIEEDAARIQSARQQFEMVPPVDLQRGDQIGPNIIQYALNQAQPVGTSAYRRAPFTSQRRYAEKCAQYRTPDVAQEEFLSVGGPQKDRLGLDPDGDGNACGWNPAVYRSLVRQSSQG